MSNSMAIVMIMLISLVWLVLFLKKKTYAMTFLIYSTIICYAYSFKISVDLVIKILFLITIAFSCWRYGVKKQSLKIFAILFILVFFGTILANFTNTYTFSDNITAVISTVLGFLIICVNWPTDDKEEILKRISFIPICSIIIGIIIIPLNIVPFFSRAGNVGLGGASMATNLSFFCISAIMAALSVYKINSNVKYRLLAYINFLILLLTLTRGGILAGFIMIFPDIIKWLKETPKSFNKFIITLLIIGISIVPVMHIAELLLERSFTNGEFNSSGRFEAWSYMIDIVDNKYIGNGFGFLKTATGGTLDRGFNAAHNEYIRIYLETGYIGLILHTILFGISFKTILAEQKIFTKKTIYFFILAFLVYSFTDNTITNYRFWIPFLFTLCLWREKKHESNVYNLGRNKINYS